MMEYNGRVMIYKPLDTGRRQQVDRSDVTASFVGGATSSRFQCPNCAEHLDLIVQIVAPRHSPKPVCLRLYSCRRGKCIRTCLGTSKIAPADGVLRCLIGRPDARNLSHLEHLTLSSAARCCEADGWMSTTGNQPTMDDLESSLAALEASSTNDSGAGGTKTATRKNDAINGAAISPDGVPSVALVSMLEPPPAQPERDGVDEDDVGLVDYHDDTIQNMLARYMAMEDDPAILSMLRESGSGRSMSNSTSKERDERLSADDRALRAYTDRLRRAPRQIVRWAPSGEPLWSIPIAKRDDGKRQRQKSLSKRGKDLRTAVNTLPEIPPCSCGAPRVFQLQVLPSILDVLQVDHNLSTLNEAYGDDSGVDFGNLAVYACHNADCWKEAFVLVQAPIDDGVEISPSMAAAAAARQLIDDEPVVIPESTVFADDDTAVIPDDAHGDDTDVDDHDETMEVRLGV